MEFKDTIGIYPNALDKDKCEEVINLFENKIQTNEAFPGTTIKGVMEHLKVTVDYNLGTSMKLKEVELKESIFNCFNTYTHNHYIPGLVDTDIMPYNKIISDNTFYNGLNLQKYIKNKGHFNGWHCENATRSTGARAFVYILYLNDVKEGGTTDFAFTDKETGKHFSVTPEQGTLIIHPTQFPYVHRGTMPTSNDKYIATTWLEFIE